MKFGHIALFLFAVLLMAGIANAADVIVYHKTACPHCERTITLLQNMKAICTMNMETKEIGANSTNMDEALAYWTTYGLPQKDWAVPSTLINGKMMIIGEASKEKWQLAFENCDAGKCPVGYYYDQNITADLFTNITVNGTIGGNATCGSNTQLTWGAVLVGALTDSVNPCEIAVMALLLANIFIQHDKKKVLLAGLAFTLTVYICYFLMGIGILTAVQSIGLQTIFLGAMTVVSIIITVLEFNAYRDYKPGMISIEMPILFRPYMKKVLDKATTIPFIIVAALFCSFFLLPCSSGPYFIVLSMLAKEKSIETLTYLAVYNMIFVMPMILVTLVVAFGFSTPEQVKEARDKYVRHMHLIAGILMLAVTALVAYQFLKNIGFI